MSQVNEKNFLEMKRLEFIKWKTEKGAREHHDAIDMTPLKWLFEVYQEAADLYGYTTIMPGKALTQDEVEFLQQAGLKVMDIIRKRAKKYKDD